MLINQGVAVSTSKITLIPYEKLHVPTYHEWMKDEEIQETTASEPLSLEEEHNMQSSWRQDHDKLTFVTCFPIPQENSPSSIESGQHDTPSQMIGDVNLFLSISDEDEEGCIGELELMIASPTNRRRGYGRATILAFMNYVQVNLHGILDEYRLGEGKEKMKLLQLRVKIGSRNEKSIKLFESIGFLKVSEEANYFGEFELVLEGWLGGDRMNGLLEKWRVENYRELEYELGHD